MTSDINLEDLHQFITQLEEGLHDHEIWYNNIMRTLICKLHPDQHDLDDDSHKQCQFGQWYYGYSAPKLRENPAFQAMGATHEEMHKLATNVLLSAFNSNNVNVDTYDNFAIAAERLQLEIIALIHEFESSLYTRDPLTRAINRIDMLPMLRELHEMTKRTAISCSLVMLDIDHFKLVNDEYGHQAGDKVLVALAQYITNNIRSYDKLFRFGGEEFIVCMLQTDLANCYQRTEQLRQGLAELPIDIGLKDPIHINASFGITLLDGDITIEQNLERVDKAMYAAKQGGRNCTKKWEPSPA